MGITSTRKTEPLTGSVAYFTSCVGGVSLPPNSFRDFWEEIESRRKNGDQISILSSRKVNPYEDTRKKFQTILEGILNARDINFQSAKDIFIMPVVVRYRPVKSRKRGNWAIVNKRSGRIEGRSTTKAKAKAAARVRNAIAAGTFRPKTTRRRKGD
jgi:hypothetical protein